MTVREIMKEVLLVEKLVGEEKTRHENVMDQLSKRLAEVRRKCTHPLTTHYPDPSGNNDSWDECAVCGSDVTEAIKLKNIK